MRENIQVFVLDDGKVCVRVEWRHGLVYRRKRMEDVIRHLGGVI